MCLKIRTFSEMLIPKMKHEHVLKVGFEDIKFGPGKCWEFSAALSVDLPMASMDLNKRHIRNLAPVTRENKRCMSQHTRITIVERVHMWPLADLV